MMYTRQRADFYGLPKQARALAKDEREEAFAKCVPFVFHLARRFRVFDADELQSRLIDLWRAVVAHDPARGTLLTLAGTCIQRGSRNRWARSRSLKNGFGHTILSLDAELAAGLDGEDDEDDDLLDPAEKFDEFAEAEDMEYAKSIAARFLPKLSPRNRLIFEDYFYRDLDMRTIAERNGITFQRVQQIISKNLSRWREALECA